MQNNPVLDKSLDFALRIVKLCHYLNTEKARIRLVKRAFDLRHEYRQAR